MHVLKGDRKFKYKPLLTNIYLYTRECKINPRKILKTREHFVTQLALQNLSVCTSSCNNVYPTLTICKQKGLTHGGSRTAVEIERKKKKHEKQKLYFDICISKALNSLTIA